MTIALGIFDVFAYAAAGSFYVALTLHLMARSGAVDVGRALTSYGSASLLGLLVACYAAGHLSYPVGRFFDRLVRGASDAHEDARRSFVAKHPESAHRPFMTVPFEILRGCVELHAPEPGLTAERHLAGALMVRGVVPCIVAAAAVSAVEIVTSAHPWLAACCAAVLGVLAPVAVHHHRMLRRWSSSKCLEIAYLVPEIDEGIRRATTP